ncbi:reverse transcriptase domain-containing protein [Tanacetum coccineum]
MEEILNKFIEEGRRKQDETQQFIKEFRTTNELLLIEQNNMLAELSIGVYELSKVVNDVLISRHDIMGITTRGCKSTTIEAPTKTENNLNQNITTKPQPERQAILEEVAINKEPPIVLEQTTEPQMRPTPHVPFPSRLRKEKDDAQQKSFIENLKQLHINIPFIEALVQMPKYAKYLKSLLTNKTRLEEACTVMMNERCSALLLNRLPSKEKDLGSFTIPCQINNLKINNALADLGASISLMPYTMYEKLGLGEPKPTRMAMIDVFNKKITLRAGDDEVVFDMDQSIKIPPLEDDEYVENYNPNEASVINSIWHIDPFDMAYLIIQKTDDEFETDLEHLRSGTLSKENVKKQELKDLPTHLEYAYLNNDEYFPIIVSSKLSEKEKKITFAGSGKAQRSNRLDDIENEGAENLAVNHLSRMENPHVEVLNENEIAVRIPDEHLMMLKAEMKNSEPWSVNITSRNEMPQNNIQDCLCTVTTLREFNEMSAYENTKIYKERTKKWHESRLRGDKNFKVGDKVLLYNSRLKMYPEKLKLKWYGPNIVKTVYPYGAIEITDKNGVSFKVNGLRLKKYHDEEFDKMDVVFVELEECME